MPQKEQRSKVSQSPGLGRLCEGSLYLNWMRMQTKEVLKNHEHFDNAVFQENLEGGFKKAQNMIWEKPWKILELYAPNRKAWEDKLTVGKWRVRLPGIYHGKSHSRLSNQPGSTQRSITLAFEFWVRL